MDEHSKSIGERLRSIRLQKGVTINKIAKETSLTPSFISQFERGLTNASVASMQKITQALDTPMGSLFGNGDDEITNNEITYIKRGERRKLAFPEPENTVDQLLTGPSGHLQVIYSTIEPGGGSGKPYAHDSDEECVVILSGTMKMSIDGEEFILHEGDSITFCSRKAHGWKNIGATTVEAMWITTPPTF
ncbi:transcriptional regulator with XRE-family HTH domain [Virgibacillus halotolerans]|uniref:helix-turn-helix domain-containing protein n=1 Tax=Virgibacillus halotolerans TaxID=1071053 RepID=UPI00195FF09F|nr:cupin domain-containing protein [Virgibacillus halotolerans]MBM7599074.1 transcriptional regulator with XRE-family HTH domain [Virgibacillus halotolerans]